ncbi:Ig-like domain-containing protein, partial [Limnohabitans sp.]|uniref:Ig-like domain-containing protein n=1 Tax=Limnohabitans sp. TaxID=1907725 RepID=UPI00286F7D51
PIAGATGASFTLTQAQVGKTITVKTAYTDNGGTAESLTSSATAVVTGGVLNAPVLTLANDSGYSNADAITQSGVVNVGGLVSGATWVYSTDAGFTWSAGSGTSLTLSGNGAKSLLARQSDAAGHFSADAQLAFTISTAAPVTAGPAAGLITVNGYLGGSATSVNVNRMVADIDPASLTFVLNGGFIGSNITTGRASLVDVSVPGQKTFWVVIQDGIYLKGVQMRMQNSGDSIQLYALAAKYAESTDLNYNFNAGGYGNSLANSDSAQGYGIKSVTLPSYANALMLTASTGWANDFLNAGDTVSATLTYDQAVVVSGTPQLGLNIGGTSVQANYVSGSGSKQLVFTYTIQTGQNDANGISIEANKLSLNGGSIQSLSGVTATLTHSSINDNAAYKVDTTAPTASLSAPVDGATNANISGNVILNFSETVRPNGSANVFIKKVSDNSTVATLDASSASIIGTGSATLVSIPYSGLSASTRYYVTVSAGAFQDLAGNNYAGQSTTGTAGWDFATATASISMATVAGDGRVNATEAAGVIALSGTIAGSPSSYVQSNISVRLVPVDGGTTVNATLNSYDTTSGNWTGQIAANALTNGKSYTATIVASPPSASSAALTTSQTVVVDTTSPTITAVSDDVLATVVGAGDIRFTVGFSESLNQVLGISHFTTSLGTVAGVSKIDDTHYQVTVTSPSDTTGNVSLSFVNATGVKDLAGNLIASQALGALDTQAVDTQPPVVRAVTDSIANGSTNDVVIFYVTLSEAFASDQVLTSGHFYANRGQVTSVRAMGDNQYAVSVRPDDGLASASVSLRILNSDGTTVLTDRYGNVMAASTDLSSLDEQSVDTLAPFVSTVTDNVDAASTNGSVSFTVTFNEILNIAPTVGHFSATNGAITAVDSLGYNQYKVTVQPYARIASGQVALTLLGSDGVTQLTDLVGNAVAASTDLSAMDSQTVDTLAPTIASVSDDVSAEITNGVIRFTVTFSEDLKTAPATAHFSATHGTVTQVQTVDARHYQVSVAPAVGWQNTTVALSFIAAGGDAAYPAYLSDLCNNSLTTNADLSALDTQGIDTQAPVVTGVVSNADGGVLNFVLTFSEDLNTALTTSHLHASVGTVSAVTALDNRQYQVSVTGVPANQVVALTLRGNASTPALSDALGNLVSSNADLSLRSLAPSIARVTDDIGVVEQLVSGASSNDAQPVVRVQLTSEAALNDWVQLYDNGVAMGGIRVLTPDDIANTYVDITTPLLLGGGHRFTVRVGNTVSTSPVSAAFSLTLDLLAPGQPQSLGIVDDAGIYKSILAAGSTTDDTTPGLKVGLTGTVAQVGDKVQLYVDGLPVGNAVNLVQADVNNGFAVVNSANSLSAGLHTLQAQLLDAVNNTSALSSALTVSVDRSAPLLSGTNIADGSTGIGLSGNLVFTFNEAVKGLGSSNIFIKRVDNNQVAQTLNGSAAVVDGSGTKATVTYTGLAADTSYYVVVESTAFADSVGNPYAGLTITGSGGFDFRTATTVTPTLSNIVNHASTGDVSYTGATTLTQDSVSLSLSGSFSRALNSSEQLVVYDGNVPLGTATKSGTTWQFDTTLSNSSLDTRASAYAAANGLLYFSGSGKFYKSAIWDWGTWEKCNQKASNVFLAGVAGHQVRIDSAATNEFIRANIGTSTSYGVWLGANDKDYANASSDQKFRWYTGDQGDATPFYDGTTGTSNGYSNFVAGGAGGIGSVDGVSMQSGSSGLWYTLGPAAEGRGYIVEWDAAAVLRMGQTHNLSVKVQDIGSGSVLSSASVNVTLDGQAPWAPSVRWVAASTKLGIAGAVQSSGIFKAAAENAATLTIQLIGTANTVTKTLAATGAQQAVVLSLADAQQLGDGIVSVSVSATDAAGLQSAANSALSFTLDATAPVAPVMSLTTAGSNPTLGLSLVMASAGVATLTAEAGSTVSVTLTGTSGVVSKTVLGAGATAVPVVLTAADVTALGQGSVSMSAVATDTVGNVGSTSTNTSFNLQLNIAPTTQASISTVTDNIGSVTGVVARGGSTDDSCLDIAGGTTASLATGESVVIYDGSARLGVATMTGATTWSFTTPALGGSYAVPSSFLAANPVSDSTLSVIYSNQTGKFYSLVKQSVTWETAATQAQTYTINSVAGRLVRIDSAVENAVVKSVVGSSWAFIGASDRGIEGKWDWWTGTTTDKNFANGQGASIAAVNGSYMNWMASSPDNYGSSGEDYAYMAGSSGQWDDVSATVQNWFVVEWAGAQVFGAISHNFKAVVENSLGNASNATTAYAVNQDLASNANVNLSLRDGLSSAAIDRASALAGLLQVGAPAGSTVTVTLSTGDAAHTVNKTVSPNSSLVTSALALTSTDLTVLGSGNITATATYIDALGSAHSASLGFNLYATSPTCLVDLSADSGVQTISTVLVTDPSQWLTGVKLMPAVQPPSNVTGVSKIKLVLGGAVNTQLDKFCLDLPFSVANDFVLPTWIVGDARVAVKYTNSNKTLVLSNTAAGDWTSAQIQQILATIKLSSATGDNTPSDGTRTITIALGNAANDYAPPSAVNFVVDAKGPAMTISTSANSLIKGGSSTITIYSDRPLTGFDASDLTVQGGTLSGFTAGANNIWTATFTPQANYKGMASVSIPAAIATDANGVSNMAIEGALMTVNTQLPQVSLSASSASVTATGHVQLTLIFNTEPRNFSADDVLISGGGSLSNLQKNPLDGTVWTADYQAPASSASVVLKVGADSYNDASGNSGKASNALLINVLTAVGDITAPTAPSVANVLVQKTGATVVAGSTVASNLLTISGSAEAFSTVTVLDAGQALGTALTNSSGNWQLSLAVSNGSHNFTATAIDAASNTSASSGSWALTVNTPNVMGVSSNAKPGCIYAAGDSINVILQLSDVVQINASASGYSDADGLPTLGIWVGGVLRQATWVRPTDQPEAARSTLLFRYTVQQGDTDLDGVSLNSAGLQLHGAHITWGASANTVLPQMSPATLNAFVGAPVDASQTVPGHANAQAIDGNGFGNPYLDALISPSVWQTTTGTTLTYYLGKGFNARWGVQATDWSVSAHDAWVSAFNQISALTGLHFTEVFNESEANLTEWLLPASVFAGSADTYSWQTLPQSASGGDIARSEGDFSLDYASYFQGPQAKVGNYAWSTMLHEIGHGLGLDHPFDGAERFPGVNVPSDLGSNNLDAKLFSIMAYNGNFSYNGANFSLVSPNNFGAFDIAALQRLYGANTQTNSGDDLYVLGVNASSTIWDTGGNDTLSAAGATASAVLDLRAATLGNEVGGGGFLSYINAPILGKIRYATTLAQGVVIENAIGTNSADILIANAADNHLTGGFGADKFVWKSGQTGVDHVTDFSTAQGDAVNLQDLLAGLSGYTASNVGSFVNLSRGGGDGLSTSSDTLLKIHANGSSVTLQTIVLDNAWATGQTLSQWVSSSYLLV